MTVLLENYGELKALVDATQIQDDIIAAAPVFDQPFTETFYGTGNGRSTGTALWLMSYVADQNAPAGLQPRVTVNGIPALVVFGMPNSGCPEFGIISLSPSVDALISGTAPLPRAGDVIVLSYAYTSNSYLRIQDPAAVNAYKGVANQGLFTNSSSASGNISVVEALNLAKSQLNGYSTPTTLINATLEENYTGQGIEKGQEVTFSSHRLGLVGLDMLITIARWSGGRGLAKKLALQMEQ